ncbi:MAG: hypothetical protein Q8O22_06605, partial [Candidatus Omnitrophota bacterium]|nr:hypothetical protein [Candidatus Omnitrophota bacterium]
MKKTCFLLLCFFCFSSILYAEPTRENGLSVHFAPKSAPELFGTGKNGFTVSQSKDLKPPSE